MRLLHHHPFMLFALVVCSLVASTARLTAEPASGQRKETAPQVRLVFLSSLVQDDELILASPGKEGKWKEFGELTARPSFITDWFEVRAGAVHLTRRTPEGLVSVGRLEVPSGARSALAVIVADPDSQSYRSKVIDPAKNRFARGASLLMNLSSVSAMVNLGETRLTVAAGATEVSKAAAEENGMYRMLVGYKDAKNEWVVCYDRYVSSNPEAREFLFLLPDEHLGLKVLALPEFGDIE